MEKQEGANFDFDKCIGPIKKPYPYSWLLSKKEINNFFEKGKKVVQKLNELENGTK